MLNVAVMEVSSKILCVPRSMDKIHSVSQAIIDDLTLERLTIADADLQKIKNELQILFYELFSNAVKHSSGDEVVFKYSISNKVLSVDVETIGNGYVIVPIDFGNINSNIPKVHVTPPYPEYLKGKQVVIYLDSEYHVFCTVENETTLTFGITQKHYEKEVIEMLNEHYGIFLINMICNEVKFTFDNKKEIFSIKKGLTN